jgi:hypothetical protein
VATATIEKDDFMRVNMNTKTILSAIGVAAVLASPVMAKPNHHQAASPAPVQTIYAPDVQVPTHNNGLNPDFQLGSEKN